MRELPITPEIQAAITRVNGGTAIDVSKVAVFESRSLNTRPLRRRTGLFQKAVTTKRTLDEMAATLNASDEGIPLHQMHETQLLNVGRLFMARVDQANDGAYELSSLFYIPRKYDDLIEAINTGTSDQVSIGINGEKLLCSACDFDYKQGTIENLMDLTCDEGHELGVDGVHLVIDGLDQWMEQSIVDTGASKGSRVVGAEASKFANTDFYRLAAKNHQNDQKTFLPLIANLADIISEEIPTVDKAEFEALLNAKFTEQNTAIEAKLAAKDEEVSAANDAREAAEAKLAETEAKLAEAEGKIDTEAATKLAAAEKALEEVTVFLKEQAKAAQVAAGVQTPQEPADHASAITLIKDSGKNLVNLFAKKEAEAEGDKGNIKLAAPVANFSAFQPRKENK